MGALAGKTALVTGAGRGIGAAIARRLARDGARVIVITGGMGVEAMNKAASFHPLSQRTWPTSSPSSRPTTAAGSTVRCSPAPEERWYDNRRAWTGSRLTDGHHFLPRREPLPRGSARLAPRADMAVRCSAARAQLLFAAMALETETTDALFQVAVAKKLVDAAALNNGRGTIQVHGGIGMTDEFDAHLVLKRAHALGFVSPVTSATLLAA